MNSASIIFFDERTHEIIETYDGEFKEKSDIYDLVDDFYQNYEYGDLYYIDYIVSYYDCTYPDNDPHPIGECWAYYNWCEKTYGAPIEELIENDIIL